MTDAGTVDRIFTFNEKKEVFAPKVAFPMNKKERIEYEKERENTSFRE